MYNLILSTLEDSFLNFKSVLNGRDILEHIVLLKVKGSYGEVKSPRRIRLG